MAEAYFDVHGENQKSYFTFDEACLMYTERKDQPASLGPSLGVAEPYVPPRQPEGPAGEPDAAPPGWTRPMMTPRRQPDDQPPSPTGKPLSNPPSPGNLRIEFGPNSTPASPENPEDRLPSYLRCHQELPSTSGLQAEQSEEEHASLPLPTGFLAELNEPVPGALQIDTENSEDQRPPSPHQYNYPPPPIPGVLAMFMVIADNIKLDLAEAHHVAKFLAHPLESYDTNADLKPEITSMTTSVYAQFMKGLAHPEPHRSFERMRRTMYKRKVKAGNRQLTRDNLELRQQLRDAQQTIINLQEQVVQLRDAQQTIIDLQEQVMQLTADLQHMAPYTQGGPNGGQNYGQNYGGYYYY